MSFSKKFLGKSPFKHGDGSGVSPSGQARLDLKKTYIEEHGDSSGGTDEEWDAQQAELAKIEG